MKMKAVGYTQSLPISDPEALQDFELEIPSPKGHDIMVEVKAISVNPVDYKVRTRITPDKGLWKILGWDAAGIVKEVGEKVTLFQPGDKVYYAGDITRPGCNAQYQLVDERIVGYMPTTLDFAQAAALPLTSICAWELLFDRMRIRQEEINASVLIIGASGGVGSIAIQLLKQLTTCTIIGTASREQTQKWIKYLGADEVINHQNSLTDELSQIDYPALNYIICLNDSQGHFAEMTEVIEPQGSIGIIDDPESLNITLLKHKSLSFHWEWMYTRSFYQTADCIEQHHILNKVADLIDSYKIKSTLAQHLGVINSTNLRKAHQLLESHTSIGKIVLEGF